MEDFITFIFLVGVLAVLVTLFFFIVQILRLKIKQLRKEVEGEKDLDPIDTLKKDIGYLMAENEEMKDELRNIKYLLSQDQAKQAINLKEYEKQQIEIDQQNKFEL